MKIVYLHQYFRTPQDAGGTRSYEMAKRFVAAGHQVHLVTASDTASKSGWNLTTIDGITVHALRLRYENRMSFRRRLVAFVAFAARSAWMTRSLRGDVVFATSTPLTIAIPALFATALRRVPLVFEVRDLWPEIPIAMGAIKNPLVIRAAKMLERLVYKKSYAVIALSDGMRQGVERTGGARRIKVVPNSCDFDTFLVPSSTGDRFRAARPWLGDGSLVVYAGTLGHVNGVSYLVRLADEYMRIDGSARFLVIGDGVETETVRALAESVGVLDKNFFMEPAMPKSQVPAALSAADVCCSLFTPLQEMEANSANKFFDALAAGRPIAINYGGWQKDTIISQGIGVILDPQSFVAAATALHMLLDDPRRMEAARTNALRIAKSSFSRDDLANELLGVLVAAEESQQEIPLSAIQT